MDQSVLAEPGPFGAPLPAFRAHPAGANQRPSSSKRRRRTHGDRRANQIVLTKQGAGVEDEVAAHMAPVLETLIAALERVEAAARTPTD